MSLINALHMLLGAGLVAFGVLTHAVWTRITNRSAKADASNAWEGDWEWIPAASSVASRPAVHRKPATDKKPERLPVDALDTAPDRPSSIRQPIAVVQRKPQRDKRPESATPDPSAAMARQVTLALVANGYDKSTAQAAVEEVDPAERATLQAWLVAALRACNPGRRGIA